MYYVRILCAFLSVNLQQQQQQKWMDSATLYLSSDLTSTLYVIKEIINFLVFLLNFERHGGDMKDGPNLGV